MVDRPGEFMARERATTQSGTFNLSDSGIQEARRKRLSGALDAASAQRVLEMLQDKSLYGSFIVSDGVSDVSFFFTRGGLRVLALGRTLPGLADRLVAMGKIDDAVAARARSLLDARKPGDKKDERDILIETLHVPAGTVDDATRELITDTFLGCLFWDNPQFEASTGEPDPEAVQRRDVAALTLSLGVKDLVAFLVTKVRQVGDLRRVVSSMQVKVDPAARASAAAGQAHIGEGPLAAVRAHVAQKVVAEPGLRAATIAQQLGLGEYELATALVDLAAQHVVKLEPLQGNKAEDLERLHHMEENVDHTLSQLVRRLRVAQQAVVVGDNVRAGRHLAGAGGLLLREGREDEAVKTLQQAVQLAPENLEGREGYVQGLWATNRVAEAVNESQELGKRYLALNLPGRAKRILERALQKDERTDALHLLVKSLIKLRQPKAATEAGERLVNRLRREGRSSEARAVAAELFELATDADKQKLLKAAGADRRAVVALLAVSLVLAGAFFPAQQVHAARMDFAIKSREADNLLRSAPDLPRLKVLVHDVHQTFAPLALQQDEIGGEARKVVAELERLQKDIDQLERLGPLFPWETTSDLELALKQFEAVRPETVALAKPIRKLISDVKEFRASADEVRQTLLRTDPGPDAIAAAVKAREKFKGLPAVLEKMVVRVKLETTPTGAQVKWDGVEYSQPTPLVIGVPLLGRKQLELAKLGFQGLTAPLGFDDLKDKPEVSFKLEAARAAPTPTEPVKPPTPDPVKPPPTTTGTPRPSGGVTGANQRPPAERTRHQVEFRDGGFVGEPDARFRFEQDYGYVQKLELQQRFRAIVQTVNKVEGSTIYLTGLRVYLEVLRSDGWKAEKPYAVEFDDDDGRRQRPVASEPGGKLKVAHVDRTHHTPVWWFKEQIEEAVQEAVRLAKIRENDARLGR